MANDVIVLLPREIIVYILKDKQLGFLDVINFSSTCRSLYEIVKQSNELWKTKFFQRWPFLKEIYWTSDLKYEVSNWKEEVKASLSSRKKLMCHLSVMSSKHYKKQELPNSEFKEFDLLFQPEKAHSLAYYFLVDELVSLIQNPDITSNLTHKYYALKVVRYLKQSHLKDEWQKFQCLPPKQQILERGATIVAQWSQSEKHVLYLAISSALDNIAEQTKELLKEQYPAHSIFSVPKERFIFWKNNIIDDNQWNILETRQITDILCKVLFEKLGFYGNNEMYYSSENSFIDYVLKHKCGIPITLAIVFESVARRLGVHCEPVSFPSHFLLRWKETYGPESKDTENFYIDVLNNGQFLTKKSCPRISSVSKCPIEKYNVYKAATAVEVVTRMANNLVIAARQYTHINGRTARLRSALELSYMVQPNEVNTILQLGRINILQHMDVTELLKILENMQKNLGLISREMVNTITRTFLTLQEYQQNIQPKEELKPKRRVPEVKYAVGLIMKHKIHGYLCVITGWDACCVVSTGSVGDMDESELELEHQPFYSIFVEDGSCLYTAQENLLLAPHPEWINHHAIGRYFYKFNGTRYIPNEEKAKEYPEDENICNELLAKYVQNEMAYDTT